MPTSDLSLLPEKKSSRQTETLVNEAYALNINKHKIMKSNTQFPMVDEDKKLNS